MVNGVELQQQQKRKPDSGEPDRRMIKRYPNKLTNNSKAWTINKQSAKEKPIKSKSIMFIWIAICKKDNHRILQASETVEFIVSKFVFIYLVSSQCVHATFESISLSCWVTEI